MEVGIILFVVILAIVIRLAAGGMDHDRVRQYIEEQGGQVLETRWAPFGPGWFAEKSDRIYEVRYLDRDGNEHVAHSKTSMLSGVYLTEDRIVKHADQPAQRDAAALEEENRQLREELRKLKEDHR